MKIETIDGTVVSAAVQRATGKVTVYSEIVFRLADGAEHRMDKVAVAPGVAEALEPGSRGRFYAYKAFDHKGIIAARTQGGHAAFAMPSGNERIMLMAAIVGSAYFVVMLVTRGGLSLLAFALAVLGGFAYHSYRKLRIESRARYDADSGYAAASLARPEPATPGEAEAKGT